MIKVVSFILLLIMLNAVNAEALTDSHEAQDKKNKSLYLKKKKQNDSMYGQGNGVYTIVSPGMNFLHKGDIEVNGSENVKDKYGNTYEPEYKFSPSVGLGFGYNFNDNFAMELSGFHRNMLVDDKHDIIRSGSTVLRYTGINSTGISLASYYNHNFGSSFIPFVGVGISAIQDTAFYVNRINLGAHIKAGADFMLTEKVALVVAYSFSMHKEDVFNNIEPMTNGAPYTGASTVYNEPPEMQTLVYQLSSSPECIHDANTEYLCRYTGNGGPENAFHLALEKPLSYPRFESNITKNELDRIILERVNDAIHNYTNINGAYPGICDHVTERDSHNIIAGSTRGRCLNPEDYNLDGEELHDTSGNNDLPLHSYSAVNSSISNNVTVKIPYKVHGLEIGIKLSY